jgi:septum formation protein
VTPGPGGAAPPLVLASASPRRARLLDMLGLAHEVLPARIDERPRRDETPEAYVRRLAREKAVGVASQRPDALVLGGDTVVVFEGELLGKPANADEARAQLARLSGRSHQVASGIALATPSRGLHTRVDTARVTFRDLDDALIQSYVDTGEPLDKAGAYGIQERGAALVQRVEGDYYAVVGLPVAGLIALFAEAGWRYTFQGLVPTS